MIRVPNSLARLAGGATALPVEGRTVAEALQALETEAPALAALVRGGGVRVFVGERGAEPQRELGPEEELFLVPSLAGG